MSSRKSPPADKIENALGAKRIFPVDRLPSQGPLDLLELRAEVQRRIRPPRRAGGRESRPEGPSPTTSTKC